ACVDRACAAHRTGQRPALSLWITANRHPPCCAHVDQPEVCMIRGEGSAFVRGVTPKDVFDFVLDPAQYTKADTKMVWVTKLADTPAGMIAREEGRFMGRFRGSVITRYQWDAPRRIDVTLEHGAPKWLHAWFDIDAVDGGTRLHHV